MSLFSGIKFSSDTAKSLAAEKAAGASAPAATASGPVTNPLLTESHSIQPKAAASKLPPGSSSASLQFAPRKPKPTRPPPKTVYTAAPTSSAVVEAAPVLIVPPPTTGAKSKTDEVIGEDGNPVIRAPAMVLDAEKEKRKDEQQPRKRKKKRKRQYQQQVFHEFQPDEDYDPNRPNDLGEYQRYREQVRQQRRAQFLEAKRRRAAGESDDSSHYSDSSDDAPRRDAPKLFAPPPSYNAPARRPSPSRDDEDASARRMAASEPATGEDAYARRVALSQAATGEDAYARRAAMSAVSGDDAYARRAAMSQAGPPPRPPPSAPSVRPPPSAPPVRPPPSFQPSARPPPSFPPQLPARPPPFRPPSETAEVQPPAFRPPPAHLLAGAPAPFRPPPAHLMAGAPRPPPPGGAPPFPPTIPPGMHAIPPRPSGAPSGLPPRPPAPADPEYQKQFEEKMQAAAAIAAKFNALAETPKPAPPVEEDSGGTFAERMFRKWGHTEGKGLGVREDGIKHALTAEHVLPQVDTSKMSKRQLAKHRAATANAKTRKWVQAPNARGRIVNANADVRTQEDLEKYGEVSRIVCLTGVVEDPEDIGDDLTDDIGGECSNHGIVERVVLHLVEPPPRDPADGLRVFVVFSGVAGAWRATRELNGRLFGGQTIRARFYNEQRFMRGDRDGAFSTV